VTSGTSGESGALGEGGSSSRDPSVWDDNGDEPSEGGLVENHVDGTVNLLGGGGSAGRKPLKSGMKELAVFREKVTEQHRQMGKGGKHHLGLDEPKKLRPPPARTPCQQELDQVLERISTMHLPDERGPLEHLYSLHIPNCDKHGLYNLKQCKMSLNGQRGECWCVNPNTGKLIQGAPTIRGTLSVISSTTSSRRPVGYTASGCSNPQPAGAGHPPPPPPLQTLAERGEPCVVGGEGFPGVLTCVFIFGKTSTELGTPPPSPSPAGAACTLAFSCPSWGGRVLAGVELGARLGRGEKEIFIFEMKRCLSAAGHIYFGCIFLI